MTVSKQALFSFCAAGIAFRLIAVAFNFYFTKVFMNLYYIEENWFQLGQTLFMIWNTINDPLFAYIQDNENLRITKTRRESILYCGPLFVISFLIPWVPWGKEAWMVGTHMICTLFLWDTMHTFMAMSLSSLYTELSTDLKDRIMLTRYYQTACLIGTPSVLILEFTSDSLHNFRAFQLTTVCIAICSGLLFLYTGKNAYTPYDIKELENKDEKPTDGIKEATNESYCKQVCQILSDRNFISFVITYFFHAFHKHFLDSFLVIVCDQLVPDEDVPKNIRSTFYGAVPFISAVVVILGASLLTRFSYVSVIRFVYVYLVVAGISMLYIGQGHPCLLMMFMILDSCGSSVTFTFFIIVQADIADGNMVKYNRKKPISSMIFGTSALLSKPAVSLSPMLAVAILNRYGYSDLKDHAGQAPQELKRVMFILVCCYPIVIGTIQFISWSFYKVYEKRNEIDISIT